MVCTLRLDELKLTNFRKFEYFSIDFNERITVLVGSNGAGKSAVLDAACVALSSFVHPLHLETKRPISPSDARLCQIEIEGIIEQQAQYPVSVGAVGHADKDDGDSITWERTLKSSDDFAYKDESNELYRLAWDCRNRVQDGDAALVLPLVVSYGTGRFHEDDKKALPAPGTTFNRLEGYRGALDAHTNYKRMLEWFYKMTAQDVQRATSLNPQPPSPLFTAVRKAVEEFYKAISGCIQTKVTYNLDINDLDIEAEMNDGSIQRLPLSLFSDGYRTVLCMVADIAYRMALLNPACGSDVLKTPGVVLIDEIDLHLHPLWQARILKDLNKMFPNVQFIVTSHAPLVISSVPASQVRILGEEEGLAPQCESWGLSANDVLTGIMGTKDRQPEVVRLLREFDTLFDKERFDEAECILDKLEGQIGPNNPDLVAARSALFLERL